MPREQMRMPSSSAGVISFYDEERSTFLLRPSHVVILGVLLAAAVMILEYTTLFR
jgi:preprotein translocase subunit Sec61beta